MCSNKGGTPVEIAEFCSRSKEILSHFAICAMPSMDSDDFITFDMIDCKNGCTKTKDEIRFDFCCVFGKKTDMNKVARAVSNDPHVRLCPAAGRGGGGTPMNLNTIRRS